MAIFKAVCLVSGNLPIRLISRLIKNVSALNLSDTD